MSYFNNFPYKYPHNESIYEYSYQRMFQDGLLLGRYVRGFVLPVLEYCSGVRWSAADTHLKLNY